VCEKKKRAKKNTVLKRGSASTKASTGTSVYNFGSRDIRQFRGGSVGAGVGGVEMWSVWCRWRLVIGWCLVIVGHVVKRIFFIHSKLVASSSAIQLADAQQVEVKRQAKCHAQAKAQGRVP